MIWLHPKKIFFPNEIEKNFFEILLPKTKKILVGIIYRWPIQNNFLKTLTKIFPSSNTDTKNIYILGEFEIIFYKITRYNVHENNMVCTKFASADAKKYHPFCTIHGLKQII